MLRIMKLTLALYLLKFCFSFVFPFKFILKNQKLGQALSNRPDIAGPIYAKELERLQDDVGPFNDKLAFDIIQKELGRPVSPMIGNVV